MLVHKRCYPQKCLSFSACDFRRIKITKFGRLEIRSEEQATCTLWKIHISMQITVEFRGATLDYMPRAQTYFRAASEIWSVSSSSICINPLKEETSLVSKRKPFFPFAIIQSQFTLNISSQAVIWTWPISGCPSSVRDLLWLLSLCSFTYPLQGKAFCSFSSHVSTLLTTIIYNKVAIQHTGVPGMVDGCKTRWWWSVKLSAKIPALNSASLKPQTRVLIQIRLSHYLVWAVFCLDRRLRLFCKGVHICHPSACKCSEGHMPDTCRTSRYVLATEQFLRVCFLLT